MNGPSLVVINTIAVTLSNQVGRASMEEIWRKAACREGKGLCQ